MTDDTAILSRFVSDDLHPDIGRVYAAAVLQLARLRNDFEEGEISLAPPSRTAGLNLDQEAEALMKGLEALMYQVEDMETADAKKITRGYAELQFLYGQVVLICANITLSKDMGAVLAENVPKIVPVGKVDDDDDDDEQQKGHEHEQDKSKDEQDLGKDQNKQQKQETDRPQHQSRQKNVWNTLNDNNQQDYTNLQEKIQDQDQDTDQDNDQDQDQDQDAARIPDQDPDSDATFHEIAWEQLELARNLFQMLNAEERVAHVYKVLGDLSLQSDDTVQAAKDYNSALEIFTKLKGDTPQVVATLYHSLYLAHRRDNAPEALAALVSAIKVFEKRTVDESFPVEQRKDELSVLEDLSSELAAFKEEIAQSSVSTAAQPNTTIGFGNKTTATTGAAGTASQNPTPVTIVHAKSKRKAPVCESLEKEEKRAKAE